MNMHSPIKALDLSLNEWMLTWKLNGHLISLEIYLIYCTWIEISRAGYEQN